MTESALSPPSSRSDSEPRSAWGAFLRALFRASASLELAVVLIAVYMAVLIWATMVMSRWYADSELKFGIYLSPWFLALNALLAINVLNAALIRWPWSRRQWPFVMIHAGIIVLLIGSWVSYRFGIDGTLSAFEGTAERRLFTGEHYFQLRVGPADDAAMRSERQSSTGRPDTAEITVPFRSGPFNWEDYGREHSWFPWSFSPRDRGLLFDRDGIRLEVLDYYHDSRRLPIPRLILSVVEDPAIRVGALGREAEQASLEISPAPRGHGANRPFGMGSRAELSNGTRLLFWMTGDRDETAAFVAGAPEGPLGPQGQVVLYHEGRTYRFRCGELLGGRKAPLGDSGLEVELVGLNPQVMGFAVPAAQLVIHRGDDSSERMLLYAALPHWNHHARKHRVFGAYWLGATADDDSGDQRAAQVRRDTESPRVDILQGYDGQLHYRSWRLPDECRIGRWAAADGADSLVGAELVVFGNSPSAMRLRLEEYIASPQPDWKIMPLSYRRNPEQTRQPRALVRLTVDGKKDEFWLSGPAGETGDDQRRTVVGAGRRVSIGMPQEAVSLGFEVFLHRFIQKLDPGQRRPSYYASVVDFRLPAEDGEAKPLKEQVLIELNRPIDFVDPSTGRSYRLFQASFEPPRRPGDPLFEQLVRPDESRSKLNRSIFSVSYDPGRAWKYFGSLLIVGGIIWLYYGRLPPRRRGVEEENR